MDGPRSMFTGLMVARSSARMCSRQPGLAFTELVEGDTRHRAAVEEEVRSIGLLDEAEPAVADELLDRSCCHVCFSSSRLYVATRVCLHGPTPRDARSPIGKARGESRSRALSPIHADRLRREKSRRCPE